MSFAHLIADSIVSLAAIAGLIMLVIVLQRDTAVDGLTKRFLFGLCVLIVLLAARVLWWLTDSAPFVPPMLLAAGLIPVAVVLLAEGLVRRHAAPIVKYGLLLGTGIFTILALLPGSLVEPARGYFLLAFQFFGFGAAGWMVVARDRASLSARENWLADRMGLSLLLILPFLATDFRFAWSQPPVRLAGIAILFTCWLTIGMRRSPLGHRDTLKSFAVLAASAMAAGFGIAALAGLDATGTIQAIAIVLSACLVAAIFVDMANLRASERRDSLLSRIAHGRETDAGTFLRGLREHMALEGAMMLEAADLAEFDTDVLRAVFADDPVRHVGDLRPDARDPGLQQLAAIFERYDATHLMLVAQSPLTLVALNAPSLTVGADRETELRAVQRVAQLISEKRHA